MSNHPSLDAYDDLFELEEGEELSLYTARDRSQDKKVASGYGRWDENRASWKNPST